MFFLAKKDPNHEPFKRSKAFKSNLDLKKHKDDDPNNFEDEKADEIH